MAHQNDEIPEFSDVKDASEFQRDIVIAGDGEKGDKSLYYITPEQLLQFKVVDTAGKLQLVRRFVEGLRPLLAEPGFRLVVKLHSRESAEDFRGALAGVAGGERIRVLSDVPLYPLLAAVDAAVVLASTVGLEALCFGLPLGVLEIPGAGFVYDYVASGAARGLRLDRPMEKQVRELLSSGPAAGAESFLDRNLGNRTGAAAAVATLVERLVEERAS